MAVTIDTIPVRADEVVRMLITSGRAGAESWYSRFTTPTGTYIDTGSFSGDNIIVVDPTPGEVTDDVELSIDRVQWLGDDNNRYRLRLNREPVAQDRPGGFGPIQASFGHWLTGDPARNELVAASENPSPGLGDTDNRLQDADPGADLAIYLAFTEDVVHEVRFDTYFYNASYHYFHVRLDDDAVRAAANAVAVDDLINLVVARNSNFAPPSVGATATFRAGSPTVRAAAAGVAKAEVRAGSPTARALAAGVGKADLRAGSPTARALAAGVGKAEFRAGRPRITASAGGVLAATFRAGSPTVRAAVAGVGKAEFRAGSPTARALAAGVGKADLRAGSPTVRAVAAGVGKAEFRAGVPRITAMARDITEPAKLVGFRVESRTGFVELIFEVLSEFGEPQIFEYQIDGGAWTEFQPS